MKKPVYYVILALLVGVFLFAAYKVGSYYLEKYRSDKVISEANRFVTLPGDSDNNDPTQDPSGDPECPTVQFDELLKTNGDVIAWIYGANTHINYPVVQGSDNDYYLRHLLDGTWNDNGSIFMDCANSADFSDQNSLIYGHNMHDGSMFGQLVRYRDEDFYKAHPTFTFDTLYEGGTWQVVAAVDTALGADTLPYYTFFDADTKLDWQHRVRAITEKALYDTGVMPEYGAQLLTLSTCGDTHPDTDARFALLAVRID